MARSTVIMHAAIASPEALGSAAETRKKRPQLP
jgi:hypothetical protein